MRLAILIVIFILFVIVATMAWQWFRTRARLQALRENPPQRVAFLVKLPKEAEKSNVKMARFYGRMERLMNHDPDAVPSNQNVISAALVGTGGAQSQAPTVRFLMWVPADMSERIQMELQECYEGQAQITELPIDKDPLTLWGDQYNQFLQWEREQQESAKQAEKQGGE